MKSIYSRVSTIDQNVEQQTALLKEQYGADCKVYEDKASGKDTERVEFQKMKEALRSGDTVIVYDISRLGRNVLDVLSFCQEMESEGVKVIVHTLGQVDVTSSTGKLVLTTLSAVAEMQRTEMLEKQSIGIARAKEQGKYKGKQQSPKTLEKVQQVKVLVENGTKLDDALKAIGLGRATYYRNK